MKQLCAAIAITVFSATPALSQTKVGGLCFAFLKTGDIFISCGEETFKATDRRAIESFAISDKTPALAYVVSRKTHVDQLVTTTSSTLTLVDLSSGKIIEEDGPDSVVSTCGGIFSTTDSSRQRSSSHDFAHNTDLNVGPYIWFRCSDNRATIVGTIQVKGADLLEGVPPRRKVTDAKSFGVRLFNISSDGTSVVFARNGSSLCVATHLVPVVCTEASGSWPDGPSVNNSGEVLVTISTDAECFYRSQSDFSPSRAGGLKSEGRDACLGIGYWAPGTKTILLLEAIGRNPQWIDAASAKLLRGLAGQIRK
jgi:hypothetical protein